MEYFTMAGNVYGLTLSRIHLRRTTDADQRSFLAQARQAIDELRKEGNDGSHFQVLIVDDSNENHIILAALLQEEGVGPVELGRWMERYSVFLKKQQTAP